MKCMVNSPWLITEEGRECAYSGPGNCGHAFRPWSDYQRAKPQQPHGRKSVCSPCWNGQRAGQRNGEYQQWALRRCGITREEYDWLLEKQGGVCVLHGGPETRKGAVRLCVDHDHKCKNHRQSRVGATHACKECIRGLLCHDCNNMVGLAEKTGQGWRFADYLGQRPFMTEGVAA